MQRPDQCHECYPSQGVTSDAYRSYRSLKVALDSVVNIVSYPTITLDTADRRSLVTLRWKKHP